MRSRPVTALLAVLVVVLGLPASAAEQVVPITAAGPSSQVLEAVTGDAAPTGNGADLLGGRYPDPTPNPEPGSPGRLDNPPTPRDYGLPTALAAVLVAGVGSLIVRLLLAEPAARRRTPGSAGPTAGAAVD